MGGGNEDSNIDDICIRRVIYIEGPRSEGEAHDGQCVSICMSLSSRKGGDSLHAHGNISSNAVSVPLNV